MNPLKSTLTLCIALAMCSVSMAQIKAVERFVTANDDGIEKFYIYQSSLRMLNQKGDADFNKLIRDVRKINVYFSEEANDRIRSGYHTLISDLMNDNFETLVSVKHDGMLINFLGKEEGKNAYYVLALNEEKSFGIMEMDGKLDLRYLGAIENVDYDKLREIVGQDKAPKHQEEEQD